MADGAQRLFSADCTIAVTGIAGPGGGTPEKPVGTVWLAARVHTTTRALTRVLPGDRDDVRRRAAQAGPDIVAIARKQDRESTRLNSSHRYISYPVLFF